MRQIRSFVGQAFDSSTPVFSLGGLSERPPHARILPAGKRERLPYNYGRDRVSPSNYLDLGGHRPPLQKKILIVSPRYHQILGIRFFDGTAQEVIARISEHGGFLVAPSAPGMVRLCDDEPYRRAMLAADLAIPDSGLMVLVWRLLRREKIRRVSGLKYLKRLLERLKGEGRIFWVLPGESAREKLLDWSRRETFAVKIDNCYLAPRYGLEVEDRHLLGLLEQRRSNHVLIAIGSGPQEKLAHYIIERLGYRPVVHCIGAALGFITGDQIAIPDWADRFYLGWLLRFLAQPRLFAPRLLMALKLPALLLRYGRHLPPLAKQVESRRREKLESGN